MTDPATVKKELKQYADPEKAEILTRYFKAVPGGYGEGDRFMGVKVLFQRKIARKNYKQMPLEETESAPGAFGYIHTSSDNGGKDRVHRIF